LTGFRTTSRTSRLVSSLRLCRDDVGPGFRWTWSTGLS
jgi:hypothetical protein